METIEVIGIGPGSIEYLTPIAKQAIESAGVLVGGKRLLETFDNQGKLTFPITNNLPEVLDFINRHRQEKVAVLASGDPGFYGILTFLRKHFSPQELTVIPGVSSVQLACAKLALPWQDARLVSVHGRELAPLLGVFQESAKIVVLTDNQTTPAQLARYLTQHNLGQRNMAVCANLGYEDETIISGKVEELLEVSDFKSSVVVITSE